MKNTVSDLVTVTRTLSAGLGQVLVNGGGEIQYLTVTEVLVSTTAANNVKLYFTGNNPVVFQADLAADGAAGGPDYPVRGADDTSLLIDIVGASTVYVTVRYHAQYRNRKVTM